VPEYPDVENYASLLRSTVGGHRLLRISIRHPFLLRTVDPDASAFAGAGVTDVCTVAKRIALAFDGDLYAAIHLMIAGRLAWRDEDPVPDGETRKTVSPRASGRGKATLAEFRFDNGVLSLTEAGTTRRASLHLLRGRAALDKLHPGGADPFALTPAAFLEVLHRENRTLKRVLTDQRLLTGIGNAYSDEILHAARMSPFTRSASLDLEDAAALLAACTGTLTEWRNRLRDQWDGAWPKKVTAFRPEMAVHGKFGAPCPRCGTPIQRIRYAENECNYCPTCQTGGVIYKDRALSRLLKDEWPRTVAELEERSRG